MTKVFRLLVYVAFQIYPWFKFYLPIAFEAMEKFGIIVWMDLGMRIWRVITSLKQWKVNVLF